MIIFGTVRLSELLWTAAAVPGLIYWAWNRATAGRAMAAVRAMGYPGGPRDVWARFSVLLTTVFVLVETGFIVAGVLAMVRPSSGPISLLGLVLALILVASSALITYVAYRWRVVDAQLLEIARTSRRQPRRGGAEDRQ